MSSAQAIILGAVQGITEFLPISSSGHLILIPEFFGWSEQGLVFDILVHMATLTAIVFTFRDEVKKLAMGFYMSLCGKKNKYGSLSWMIIIATIPAIIFALLAKDLLISFRSIDIVIFSLAFWGIVLIAADLHARKKITIKNITNTGWTRAVFIGAAQAIALIPGTSRSGITISAGLFSGLDRESALRFSFLLGIPAIAAAGISTLLGFTGHGSSISSLNMFLGFTAALISGLLSIRFLLFIARKASFIFFGAYRIILACILLIIFYT